MKKPVTVFKPSERITIPSPMKLTAPRGLHSDKTADPVRAVRMDDTKYDAIVFAARVLGMTAAEFIRWVSYLSANEILRQYNASLPRKEVKPMPTSTVKTRTTLL